jgi:hypothetical protein
MEYQWFTGVAMKPIPAVSCNPIGRQIWPCEIARQNWPHFVGYSWTG